MDRGQHRLLLWEASTRSCLKEYFPGLILNMQSISMDYANRLEPLSGVAIHCQLIGGSGATV